MRRFIAIFGTLLIAMILFSGSAVAAWYWVTVYDYGSCTAISDIAGAPNGKHATIGQNGTPDILGWVVLDMGLGNEMPPRHDFTVYAYSGVEEFYAVWIGETTDFHLMSYLGSGGDTDNVNFTKPSTPVNAQWRYIAIYGTTGIQPFGGDGDYAYGPDIASVGTWL